MNKFVKPEAIILAVLNQVEIRLPDDTVRIVGELIEHNEAGVALETLCSQVYEYDIVLSDEDKAKLKDAACLLGIPLSQLDGLSDS